MTSKRALGKIKGMSEAKVDKIREAASKLVVSELYNNKHLIHKNNRTLVSLLLQNVPPVVKASFA